MLCNLIIYYIFNLESDVDALICFNVQLFSVDSPSPQWDDVGPFDLDGAMSVAEDITAPYT